MQELFDQLTWCSHAQQGVGKQEHGRGVARGPVKGPSHIRVYTPADDPSSSQHPSSSSQQPSTSRVSKQQHAGLDPKHATDPDPESAYLKYLDPDPHGWRNLTHLDNLTNLPPLVLELLDPGGSRLGPDLVPDPYLDLSPLPPPFILGLGDGGGTPTCLYGMDFAPQVRCCWL